MLWSNNAILFSLFSVQRELEIRFNDVLDKKEAFFDYKNNTFSKSQKWHFSKGVNPCFWSKNAIFFLDLFSVKKGLEIRFNDVLDRKETFFLTRRKIFEGLKNSIFPKGLTHAFGQKMPNFSLFRFGRNTNRNNA